MIKNWNRINSCSIKGANTYLPFCAGSADMTETNGKLYIHTCHEMYKTEDGYHHQANCTFVINENKMAVIDSYYDIMNLSYGYVSHSFSQKIATDGNDIYRADLGDAYLVELLFLSQMSITKYMSLIFMNLSLISLKIWVQTILALHWILLS